MKDPRDSDGFGSWTSAHHRAATRAPEVRSWASRVGALSGPCAPVGVEVPRGSFRYE